MHPLNWKGKVLTACVLIAIAYLATGCATVEPYAEVGVKKMLIVLLYPVPYWHEYGFDIGQMKVFWEWESIPE